MAIVIERNKGLQRQSKEQFGLECPYCGIYSHMTPQSIPDFDQLCKDQPKHVGLVYQCDACQAPVFLRFAAKQYSEDTVELYRNFIELERPKERFAFSYLPKRTEILFREALSCYSHNYFNAFASMCHRAADSSFAAIGERGKMRAFDHVIAAQELAEIDDNSFHPIKKVLFESGEESDLPSLNHAQAGILLEVLKDMFYQCFVRRGKLTRAIKVRHLFIRDDNNELRPSA
ncbi:MAG: hypothetical protein IIC61_12535 [Proteobacteria bacterium]|nr:hypothetical protein [Pseudomonadota bacterium]